MRSASLLTKLTLFLGLMVASAAPRAAGGHHGVDDAALLEPGQCQLELWQERGRGNGHRLQHLGPTCRLGALEWSLNLDRSRSAGGGEGGDTERSWGPQAKWATSGFLHPDLSIGLVWGATLRPHQRPRLGAQSLLLPLSWQATPSLALHLNLGRDFRRQAPM
ncbi:hypothetical protein G8A07_09125 [Roseateles sp. DAIF2]|uniref:hypothetical protein n=1 Tax=Roseateles sp. DAIF2 TaxID=2714952 RepID=UPI0018A26A85|nr:hypothetical protein [Roseateles sp. DAIF2]QPF73061.1 hypothetical protein G8A07_09125 [Roseateles sp. DAIF2]